jgi:galactokinase
LIGDHVDYNGLPVLPMALQRELALLCRRRSDATVRIANADPRFASTVFPLSGAIEPSAPGDWVNYVKAAAQGLVLRHGNLRGCDAVVTSDLPIASGLSSSSALVVAVALTVLTLNGLEEDRVELAALLARAERYVGTAGGGMDQAICLCAREGSAARIDFEPLRLSPIAIPDDWRFVVAFTLREAPKSGSAQAVYNRRTEECAEALAMVVRAAELGERVGTYGDLLAHCTVPELTVLAERALSDTLFRRFRHVVSEGGRVLDAETALRADNAETFALLMNESHASLRDDYDVSAEELDLVTQIARAAGARGARLTGAGLGGCAVALCDAASERAVSDALTTDFYGSRDLGGRRPDDVLFVAKPSAGASVHEI